MNEGPSDVMVATGNDSVDFRCVASTDSSTPLTLSWRKDDADLDTHDPRVNLTEDNTLLTIDLHDLSLEEIEKNYTGVYKCIASNGYSSQEMSAKFAVQISYHLEARKKWPVVFVVILLLLILVMFGMMYQQKNTKISYYGEYIMHLVTIGSDNSLSPVWHKANAWTNAALLFINWALVNTIQWNLNQNTIVFNLENLYENVAWKRQPFRPCLDICIYAYICIYLIFHNEEPGSDKNQLLLFMTYRITVKTHIDLSE